MTHFLWLAVFVPLLLFAQEKSHSDVYVELILDASGSMEEMISGKTKMQIAKDVLSKYAKKVNEEYHLGLRVYGNTKRKDCKDSHLLVPIEQKNRDQIISEIKGVTALSMTPIGYSLKKAGEDLKLLKDKGTIGIVLVTDGQESCDLDPCQVAKDLIKEGLQLKINVVGFDIKDKKSHDQLKCIAQATGGTYVTSNNADSLYKMLEKSVETVAKVDWNLRVHIPDAHESYYLDVLDEKTGKKVLEHQYAHRGYLLPDGVYTVTIHMKPEYVEKNVHLTQSKQTIIQVKGFGTLKVQAHEGQQSIYMTVKDSSGKVILDKVFRYSAGHLLPVGSYTVELSTKKGPVLWSHEAKIEEGKMIRVQMTGFGIIRADAYEGQASIYMTVKDSSGKVILDKVFRYSAGHLLPVGSYTVELSTKKGPVLWSHEAKVEEGKMTKVHMTGFGTLRAREPVSRETLYLTVKDLSGKILVDKKYNYSAGYLLPIGKYTVELSSSRGPTSWTKKDVSVEENKLTTVSFE